MDKLIKAWEDRVSWMLAYAELHHYEGNEDGQHHMETCARQWRNAIEELKEHLSDSQQN